MVNDINDVYTGQMQGVSPEQLQKIAMAKAAQGKLGSFSNGPSMQAALRNYEGSPLKVRGQGASAAAPSILEGLGQLVQRRQGKSKLNEMEQQSQALRGQITEGSIAEQRANLQAQDYQNQMDAQQANVLAAAKVEAAKQKAITDKGSNRSAGLTQNAVQSGLTAVNRKVSPIMKAVDMVHNIDKQLAPYSKGGEKYGKNIKGLGILEGGRGNMGAIARYIGDIGDPENSGQNMQTNISALVKSVLKGDAGTAQTFQETRNVLMGLGLAEGVEEEVFLEYLPQIKTALIADMRLAEMTSHEGVRNTFVDGYGGRDKSPFNIKFTSHDWGKGDTAAPAAPAAPATRTPEQQRRLEELEAKEAAGTLDAT
jgi:hypothetical protein